MDNKAYIVIDNNQLCSSQNYKEWADSVYTNKEDAEERKMELIRNKLGLLYEPEKEELITTKYFDKEQNKVEDMSYYYCPIRIEEHTLKEKFEDEDGHIYYDAATLERKLGVKRMDE